MPQASYEYRASAQAVIDMALDKIRGVGAKAEVRKSGQVNSGTLTISSPSAEIFGKATAIVNGPLFRHHFTAKA